jgi:hypothetical protein
MQNIKLSDAIKLGAMLKPQGRGADSISSADESCAIGAALDACGVPVSQRLGRFGYVEANMRWHFLFDMRDRCCPECGLVANVMDIIWHLNDVHKLTREAIADFIATIEPVEQSTDADASSLPDAVVCPVEVKAV